MSDPKPFTLSGFAKYIPGVGVLKANGGDLGGGSETLIVEQIPEPAEETEDGSDD